MDEHIFAQKRSVQKNNIYAHIGSYWNAFLVVNLGWGQFNAVSAQSLHRFVALLDELHLVLMTAWPFQLGSWISSTTPFTVFVFSKREKLRYSGVDDDWFGSG